MNFKIWYNAPFPTDKKKLISIWHACKFNASVLVNLVMHFIIKEDINKNIKSFSSKLQHPCESEAGVCDLLCACQGSCVYFREVVFMSKKLCVCHVRKVVCCQGICVYVKEVVCMSGKLCVRQESCLYVREVVCIRGNREVVCMWGKLCVCEKVVCMSGKLCGCEGSCVHMTEVGCMSGKLCAYEGSCVDVREVVCMSGVCSWSSSLKCLFRFSSIPDELFFTNNQNILTECRLKKILHKINIPKKISIFY